MGKFSGGEWDLMGGCLEILKDFESWNLCD